MSRIDKALTMVRQGQLLQLLGKSLRFLFKIPYSFFFATQIKNIENQSVEQLIDFMYNKGFNLITPAQIQSEIRQLGEIVRELKPKNILEIGTANGGSLFLFCKLADQPAKIISLDLPWGKFGGGYPLWKIPLYQSFVNEKQNLHLLRANSHLEESVDRIKKILGEEKLDFLFIDGDHTYEGVKRDFLMYSPLVRSGGIIAMHDITPHLSIDVGVDKFWQEIKGDYQNREIISVPMEHWAGIGVIYNNSLYV
ncbi:MAG: class I SAM-dependent methyltransferase [Patescibacteria group bacterium]